MSLDFLFKPAFYSDAEFTVTVAKNVIVKNFKVNMQYDNRLRRFCVHSLFVPHCNTEVSGDLQRILETRHHVLWHAVFFF